jgi:ketosteroid isomerase-like protein
MATIQNLDAELNQMILEGQILEAFDRFYGEDVVMQENAQEPTVGKAANRAREEQFVNSVAELHEVAISKTGANGDTTFSVWLIDATYKGGPRVRQEQVAVRTWKDGKVVREQFFHA